MWQDPEFNVIAASRGVFSVADGFSFRAVHIRDLYPDSVSINLEKGNVDISEEDIEQGSIGDCWLLSALSVIALKDKQKLLDTIVESNSAKGWTKFSILDHTITVDHFLPCVCKDDKIVQVLAPQLSFQKEYWPIVLEKAIIKFLSCPRCPVDIKSLLLKKRIEKGLPLVGPSYNDIHGGFPRWVFSLLYNVTLDPIQTQRQPLPWSKILSENGILACACTSCELNDTHQSDGFVYGHAYAILQAKDNLIRVRNPWGKYENTKYADGIDDGSFWIDEEQFREKFPHVVMLRLSRTHK
tara:strand:+ start:6507 stop:7397 length:891 start_codon:yes stop_codon:yes gene_type:complete